MTTTISYTNMYHIIIWLTSIALSCAMKALMQLYVVCVCNVYGESAQHNTIPTFYNTFIHLKQLPLLRRANILIIRI